MARFTQKVSRDGERPPIRLQSGEGDVLEITYRAALMSATIRWYEFLPKDAKKEDDDEPYRVGMADTSTLKKIIQWCQFHEQYAASQVPDEMNKPDVSFENVEDPHNLTEKHGSSAEERTEADTDGLPIPTGDQQLKTDNPPSQPTLEGQDGTDVSVFQEEFFKVDNLMLFNILQTANYLDIVPLLDAGAKVLAAMIKGKDASQISEVLKI